ncbi:sugar phosphate nucleotidyltransferase [Rhodococcus pyridinivorans]|uniref:NDP-sugar synthase n=1 Tax=Rhodococcus pyridinivorans TaxID=103816 RepID=A0A7M2XXN4_9NOCA|nr:NDP-sugar synthase [Rhodococcus pyridinivorans]
MSAPQLFAGEIRGVILAAGRGTRLGGITATLPKPLVPVLNRPLVEWIVKDLAAIGVTQVIFNLHYLAPAIMTWTRTTPVDGVRLTAVTEDQLSGPAGGLAAVLEHLSGAEYVVVVSGDACTTVDFGAVVQEHHRRKAAMTVVTQAVEDPRPFGQVQIDAHGWIIGMVRDTSQTLSSRIISTGIYVVSPQALQVLSDLRGTVQDLDFDRHFVPELLRRGLLVAACETSEYWSDIGVPRALLLASQHLLDTDRLSLVARPCQDTINAAAAEVWCQGNHPTVEGTITGRVLLGEDVRVSAGSRIEGPTVLGANTTLARGSVVRRSITMPNTQLPAGIFEETVLFGRHGRH